MALFGRRTTLARYPYLHQARPKISESNSTLPERAVTFACIAGPTTVIII